jgi:amino acid transporter
MKKQAIKTWLKCFFGFHEYKSLDKSQYAVIRESDGTKDGVVTLEIIECINCGKPRIVITDRKHEPAPPKTKSDFERERKDAFHIFLKAIFLIAITSLVLLFAIVYFSYKGLYYQQLWLVLIALIVTVSIVIQHDRSIKKIGKKDQNKTP